MSRIFDALGLFALVALLAAGLYGGFVLLDRAIGWWLARP